MSKKIAANTVKKASQPKPTSQAKWRAENHATAKPPAAAPAPPPDPLSENEVTPEMATSVTPPQTEGVYDLTAAQITDHSVVLSVTLSPKANEVCVACHAGSWHL